MNANRRATLVGVLVVLAACGAPGPSGSGVANLPGQGWSRHELGAEAGSVRVLAASQGGIVGFGMDPTGGSTAYRSTDGLTWTALDDPDPLDDATIWAIGVGRHVATDSAEGFLAVGSRVAAGGSVRAAAWVFDGHGWKSDPGSADLGNSTGSGGAQMTSVAYGSGTWVAGGQEDLQGGVVWTTVDGFAWRRVALPSPGSGIKDVAAAGPGFVAVGAVETTAQDVMPGAHAGIWTSVDGTTWARVPDAPLFSNAQIGSVIAGGPGVIAVGSTLDASGVFAPAVWTSPDGLTWTKEPPPTDPSPWVLVDGALQGRVMVDVVAVSGGFVAVGTEFGLSATNLHRGAVWTSADGRTWVRVPHGPIFDGGEDSGIRYGIASITVVGERLIALGNTPSGPTQWVSPPAAGGVAVAPTGSPTPAPRTPVPTMTPVPTVVPTPAPTAPLDIGAAAFGPSVCAFFDEFELAFGNDAGAKGPEAQALSDALRAHDAAAISKTVGPVKAHIGP